MEKKKGRRYWDISGKSFSAESTFWCVISIIDWRCCYLFYGITHSPSDPVFLYKTLFDQCRNVVCQRAPRSGRKTSGDRIKRDIGVIADDCKDFLPAGKKGLNELSVYFWRDKGRILQHLAILCSIQQYCAILGNDIQRHKQNTFSPSHSPFHRV